MASSYPAHGKEGSVAAGAVVVAKTHGWTYEAECDAVEVTYQGATAKSYKAGIPGGRGTVNAVLDADDSGQVALAIGAEITLNLYPDGATSGDDVYSGTVVITSRSVTVDDTGIEVISFGFAGVLTQGNVGA